MGGHPPYGQGPGGVSFPGGDMDDGKSPAEDNIWDVEIHLGRGSKGGGGVLDDIVIRQVDPEQVHTVYRYAITFRPL